MHMLCQLCLLIRGMALREWNTELLKKYCILDV